MFSHNPFPIPKRVTGSRTTPSGRYYITETGQRFPSITTVLDHAERGRFSEWESAIGKERADWIRKNATLRGSALHCLVERYLNNVPWSECIDDMMPDTIVSFQNIKQILSRISNIRGIEETMIHCGLRIAGTTDTIADFDGELSVIDYKTSSRPKEASDIINYFIQLTAYAEMFKETTGINIRQGVIIMTAPNFGKAFKIKIEDYVPDLKQKVEQFYEKVRNAISSGDSGNSVTTLC